MICRHCHTRNVNRPRGLCWTCYYTPGVSALYPSTSPYARRGVGGVNTVGPLPKPSNAHPGTEDKIALMMDRAEKGEQLHHPDEPALSPPARSAARRVLLPTEAE